MIEKTQATSGVNASEKILAAKAPVEKKSNEVPVTQTNSGMSNHVVSR